MNAPSADCQGWAGKRKKEKGLKRLLRARRQGFVGINIENGRLMVNC